MYHPDIFVVVVVVFVIVVIVVFVALIVVLVVGLITKETSPLYIYLSFRPCLLHPSHSICHNSAYRLEASFSLYISGLIP